MWHADGRNGVVVVGGGGGGYAQAGMSVTPIPFTQAHSWQHQADLTIQPQRVMQIPTVFLCYNEKESDLLS